MKTLILLILMVVPCTVFSQSQDSIYQYCQVRIHLGRKINMEVDSGQERKMSDKDMLVKDEDGNVKSFNSLSHALNYMGSLGWRVIQTYTTGTDPSLSSVYFLMETRKKLIK